MIGFSVFLCALRASVVKEVTTEAHRARRYTECSPKYQLSSIN